jgi:hypothetical protein
MVTACQPFATITRLVNQNRTLFSQFMDKVRLVVPKANRHLLVTSHQAAEFVVLALNKYLVAVQTATETDAKSECPQDLELEIIWAPAIESGDGDDTATSLLEKMLADIRVDDTLVAPFIHKGKTMPQLDDSVKGALAALAVLLRSLAPPGDAKAHVKIGEEHKKLQRVLKELQGMASSKAKTACIHETPIDLLKMPRALGNVLKPFPDIVRCLAFACTLHSKILLVPTIYGLKPASVIRSLTSS